VKVILAGYNRDCTINPRCAVSTPETIAAAYARISRSPLPVDQLRAIAAEEVDQARRSMEKIVFEMGHSSIAEHALFNVDIIGISRRLVEEVEQFRLVSFTEKSQRYCLFSDDFTLPEEITSPALKNAFITTVRQQQAFYHRAYEAILAKEDGDPLTEHQAKEDARYAISLATHTQLGMTINSRNLELMIRRLAAHPCAEARDLARHLYEATYPIAPSLIRYTAPTTYDQKLFPPEELHAPAHQGTTPADVRLIWATPDADIQLAATLRYRRSPRDFETCRREILSLSPQERRQVVIAAFRHLQPQDHVWREFEIPELLFELTVSASCFAQLKRHRMATIITQPYQLELGVTIPKIS